LEVKFKEKAKIEKLVLGQFNRAGAKRWFIRTQEGKLLSSEKTPDELKDWRKISLGKDGYIAFCGSPMGSVAVFNLGDEPLDVYAQKDSPVWEIRFPVEGRAMEKGESLMAKVLVVGTPFTVEPDERWIEWVRETMGLSGDIGYNLRVEKGKVIGQRYVLEVDGGGEGFSGKIGKANLPLTLPIAGQGIAGALECVSAGKG
jgi:hypothetical protein